VLLRQVNATSAAAEQLRRDDVLMSFDGQAIANDGTVPFRCPYLPHCALQLLWLPLLSIVAALPRALLAIASHLSPDRCCCCRLWL
jgi:hypothetical protein